MLLGLADDVVGHSEVCQASGRPLRLPVAGTSLVSSRNEKVRADFRFVGDIIALRAMDLHSNYPL